MKWLMLAASLWLPIPLFAQQAMSEIKFQAQADF